MTLNRILILISMEREMLALQRVYLQSLLTTPGVHPDNMVDIRRQIKNTHRRLNRLRRHPKVVATRALVDRQIQAAPGDRELLGVRTMLDIEIDGY